MGDMRSRSRSVVQMSLALIPQSVSYSKRSALVPNLALLPTGFAVTVEVLRFGAAPVMRLS